MTRETRPEARLRRLLDLIAGLVAAAIVVSAIASAFHLTRSFAAMGLISSDTLAGLGMVFVLAWLGAADVRRFRSYVDILAVGLIVEGAVLIVLVLVEGAVDQLRGTLVLGVIYAVVGVLVGVSRIQANDTAPARPGLSEKPITAIERVGQIVLGLFGVVCLALTVASLALSRTSGQPAIVGGLVEVLVYSGALALLAASDVRRRGSAITALTLGLVLAFVLPAVVLGNVVLLPLLGAVSLFALYWAMIRGAPGLPRLQAAE